jgi:hypothetical protein
MPKSVLKIDKFHGGMNNDADPRDIADIEMVDLTDVDISSIGRIKMLGGFIEHESTASGHRNSNTSHGTGIAGKGLFAWSSDYAVLHTDGTELANATITPTNYFLLYHDEQGASTEEFTIFQKNGAALDWKANDAEEVLGAPITSLYSIDGDLRISTNDSSHPPKFWGVIKPKHYGVTDSGTAHGGVERTGGASNYLPYYHNPATIYGALPVEDNADGDSCTVNGIMINAVGSTNDADSDYGFAGETNLGIGNDHNVSQGGTETGTAKSGFALEFAEGANDTGTWMPNTTTTYKFYITTVFDNGTQESEPQLLALYGSNNLHPTDDYVGATAKSEIYFTDSTSYNTKGQDVSLYMTPVVKLTGATYTHTSSNAEADYFTFGSSDATNTGDVGNKRISGVNIYYSSNEDGHSDLWRVFEIDFAKGVRPYGMDGSVGGDGFAPWTSHQMDGSGLGNEKHYLKPVWSTSNNFKHPPKVLSYFTANQHEHTDAISLNTFKTSVVANNRVYAGNYNQTIDGVPTQFSDRIIFSSIRQPDKFPQNNFIPTAVNDGDEIVALAVYNDRLLQFNNNVLYIHNISQAEAYLEDTYKFKGVSHPASVCTTDNGIAWANEKGAYLYTGSKVVNLIEKNAQHIISPSTWSTFSDTPMVGYISDKRQLLFADDISNTGDGAIYIYDLVTSSWVKGSDASILANIKTNFVNDYNGDLIYYDYTNQKMEKWDSGANTGTLSILTKDIDFGQPSIRKKIYKVYITYKSDSSVLPILYYDTDGDTTLTTAANVTTNFADTNNQWTRAEFYFNSDANNCYSIQFKLSGNTHGSFEINDISIVYRMKRIK